MPVRLLRAAPRDSAPLADTTSLASAVTASDGAFLLAAPGPGSYRARIGDAFFAPAATLASADSVDLREYRLVMPKLVPCARIVSVVALDSVLRAGRALCAFQVERQAATVPGSLSATYPRTAQANGGRVVAQFVVDTTGHADMSTWKVLESTNDLFSQAAKDGTRKARFYAAEIGGKKVKQLVQLPFTFTLETDGAPANPPTLFGPPFKPLPSSRGFP